MEVFSPTFTLLLTPNFPRKTPKMTYVRDGLTAADG